MVMGMPSARWMVVALLGGAASCGVGEESSLPETTAQVQGLTLGECTGRNATAVTAGGMAGVSIVQQAWNKFNDCAGFAAFEEIVRSSTAGLTCQGSTYTVCRCLGYLQSIEDKLADLKAACSGDSGRDATTALKMAAADAGLAGDSSPPAACTNSDEASEYNAGLITGESYAAQAWKGCGKVTLYMQAISDTLSLVAPPADASHYVMCRLAGLKDGLWAKARALASTCLGDAPMPQ